MPKAAKILCVCFCVWGFGGRRWGLDLCPFLTISDVSCLCYANLPRAGNPAKLTAGQRLEWLYQSLQVGSLKPTQTYNLSWLTLLSSQNNHELQWLVLLPEQWWWEKTERWGDLSEVVVQEAVGKRAHRLTVAGRRSWGLCLCSNF